MPAVSVCSTKAHSVYVCPMPSWLRSVLVFFGILLAIMGVVSALVAVLKRLPPGAAAAVMFLICGVGIPAALWWRVRWGEKNPPPPGSTDSW